MRPAISCVFSCAAWAACLAACAAGEETTRLGYVVAPSVPADPTAALPGMSFDAGPGRYRALPPEPMDLGCTREILCQREELELPSTAYPPPFERCAEQYAKGRPRAQLSAVETRRARQVDPTTCCYVELRNCGRSAR
jgi:hypothetical protein